MPTLMQRLQKFLSGPQGQRLIAEGQRQLAKPENRARLRKLATKIQNRRR
ncbi:hypothetical protein AB0M36_21165 [Actinoplanes sp. NPDC051346]